MSCTISRRHPKFCSEPYYPPGYCGYSPQFPFQFGDTYGKTTHRLLTDPKVAKSGRLVLADIFPSDTTEEKRSDKNEWLKHRKDSWGDKKLSDKMVPGYTGYIPKSEDYFGARYAQICDSAILDYSSNRRAYDEKRKQLAPQPPKVPIRAEPKPYVSTKQPQHSVSPYFMETMDPSYTFVSGYTGFIPRARSRFALVYPQLTHEALKDFTKNQKETKMLQGKPVVINRESERRNSTPPVYVTNGLLPHYTGYLPGHKFRYGVTFGASSRYFHVATRSSDNLPYKV